MMNNSASPTNSPAPNAEEGATSAPLEKLPKLNLPPKPVLATAANTPATAAPVTPAAKPTAEPPPIAATPTVPPPTPAPVVAPAKKSEPAEVSAANKKTTSLNMPLAMIAFVVALLALIVQAVAFLHLF